jgi:MFS family permease
VNNLNDGVVWSIGPLFFLSLGHSVAGIGLLAGLYPAVWGVCQLATGPMSDRFGRRGMTTAGMVTQGGGLFLLLAPGDAAVVSGLVLLGLGTAMVYPTLLAAVSDIAHPSRRAAGLGVYRFWRDLGYVAGALAAGLLSDLYGMEAGIAGAAALTVLSGLLFLAYRPPALSHAGAAP